MRVGSAIPVYCDTDYVQGQTIFYYFEFGPHWTLYTGTVTIFSSLQVPTFAWHHSKTVQWKVMTLMKNHQGLASFRKQILSQNALNKFVGGVHCQGGMLWVYINLCSDKALYPTFKIWSSLEILQWTYNNLLFLVKVKIWHAATARCSKNSGFHNFWSQICQHCLDQIWSQLDKNLSVCLWIETSCWI